MEFELVTYVDRLVVDICADPQRSFDDLLHGAHVTGALGPVAERGSAQLLRALRPGPHGDLLASSALRLLASRRAAVDESSVKPQLADWLDTHYHDKLAPYYVRPRTRNAFEVLNAMTPVVPTLEDAAHSAVAALRSLEGVEQLRREVLRLVNGAAGRVVFRPFLLPAALGEQLRQVFDAAIELRKAEESDAVNRSYRKLQSYLEELELLVDANATHYGRTILLAPVDAVREAAKRKIELRSPPARLTFDVSERPLPLLEGGVTATVALTVTNAGDAPAEGVVLNIASRTAELVVPNGSVALGRMEPQTRQAARVDVLVENPITAAVLALEAQWTNVDHSIGTAQEAAEIRAHAVHIDWPSLEGQEPFANYPVEQPDELVGRQRQLTQLRNAYSRLPLANCYVTGQRRVGKTSLVRVFVNELRAQLPKLCAVTVELGEARGGDGESTIGNLGRKLAERVVREADLAGEISIPMFDDSLAPLTDVVEQILEWDSQLRFLFVIDEFDELPHETYRRDGPGDALFVPMRSLAQKPHVGWLLVGGEKMPFIRDEQATRLNNFRDLSLDYLELHEDIRDRHGKDFGELVQRPLPEGFVVEDSAVRAIYDASCGNPHFAKELCATLFARSVARRDAMITLNEVNAAIAATARERDVELFAHFWEDGIFDVEEERRRAELARRDYLVALAHLLRAGTVPTEERMRQTAEGQGIDAKEADRLRTEFVRRKILDDDRGMVGVHVPLFRLWLESEGIYKLPPKGLTEKIGQRLTADAETLRVTAAEVRRLTKQWDRSFKYRGERVHRDQVDSWLEQFQTPVEQRLAFRLLERMHVMSDAEIYAGLRRLHRQVASGSTVRLERGQKRLTHVLVAPLGTAGASGESFAYTYRQANNIGQPNVVPTERLVNRLLQRTDVQAVVLVDDFIGTGRTAKAAIEPLARRAGELRARSEVHWYLFAVSGRVEAAAEVAGCRAARELGLEVELAFPLLEADMPLAPRSTVFTVEERPQAERMLRKYGEGLARWPLGYGDQCALVVFPDNCPNNCPPILWSDQNGWKPLFRRTAR